MICFDDYRTIDAVYIIYCIYIAFRSIYMCFFFIGTEIVWNTGTLEQQSPSRCSCFPAQLQGCSSMCSFLSLLHVYTRFLVSCSIFQVLTPKVIGWFQVPAERDPCPDLFLLLGYIWATDLLGPACPTSQQYHSQPDVPCRKSWQQKKNLLALDQWLSSSPIGFPKYPRALPW